MLRNSSAEFCYPKKFGESGQVAVVILLVVVVLATLGLSQLSQTTEDLFISSQREESTRVFNAAESGVEEALSDESNFESADSEEIFSGELDGSNVNVTVEGENDLETSILEGETATVQLSGGNVTVNWDTSADSCDGASLALAIYTDDGDVDYTFVQPNGGGACTFTDAGRNNDEFADAGSTGVGSYNNAQTISVGPDDELLRITALYAPTDLMVSGAGTMQAHRVRSTAETQVEGGEDTIQQIIEVQRSLPSAPDYMNYALYSDGSISRSN